MYSVCEGIWKKAATFPKNDFRDFYIGLTYMCMSKWLLSTIGFIFILACNFKLYVNIIKIFFQCRVSTNTPLKQK